MTNSEAKRTVLTEAKEIVRRRVNWEDYNESFLAKVGKLRILKKELSLAKKEFGIVWENNTWNVYHQERGLINS